jgi:hypothetical protein
MADGSEGRIPQDVLDCMACSIDAWAEPESQEKLEIRRVLESYEKRAATADEPVYRKRLSQLYSSVVPLMKEDLLTPSQREALGRCAEGAAYLAED